MLLGAKSFARDCKWLISLAFIRDERMHCLRLMLWASDRTQKDVELKLTALSSIDSVAIPWTLVESLEIK